METVIDSRSVAEAILAAVVLTQPSAFVANVLKVHERELLATIQGHIEACIVAYHEVICSHEDPISDCLCRMATAEIFRWQCSQGRN